MSNRLSFSMLCRRFRPGRGKTGLLALAVLALLPGWHGMASAQGGGGGALFIVASSPGRQQASVEFMVTDPNGKRTGVDPASGRTYAEIPRGSYGAESIANDEDLTQEGTPEEKQFTLTRPDSGSYVVKLIARADGPYMLDLLAYDAKDASSGLSFSGTASAGEIFTYRITYSSAPGAQLKGVQIGDKGGAKPR